MPWRQLPDGSWLDTDSGNLAGYDPEREALGRQMSMRAGQYAPRQATGLAGGGTPRVPLPQQERVVLPGANGPQSIIDPQKRLLSVSPYELGLGATPMPDATKKILMVGVLIAGCAAYCWWNRNKSKA